MSFKAKAKAKDDIRTRSRTALDNGVRENIKLRKSNSKVAQVHAINPKAKAKDLTFKAKAKAKDSKFALEDSSRPRTKAKDNNTAGNYHSLIFVRNL